MREKFGSVKRSKKAGNWSAQHKTKPHLCVGFPALKRLTSAYGLSNTHSPAGSVSSFHSNPNIMQNVHRPKKARKIGRSTISIALWITRIQISSHMKLHLPLVIVSWNVQNVVLTMWVRDHLSTTDSWEIALHSTSSGQHAIGLLH